MTTALPTTSVRFPKAQGYGAKIDDLYVRLAPDKDMPLRVYTRDSLAERQDDRGSFYENVLDIGYVWARTDWSGGEGLDWDPSDRVFSDAERDLHRIRYWDSSLVDVSPGQAGEAYTLDLARKFLQWGGSTTAPADMAASSQYLFVADGDTVSWYSSWTNTTPVGSDAIATSVDAVAIAAAPNDACMAVGADGHVYLKGPSASTFADVYTPAGANLAATGVWFAKGRWIVARSDGDTAQLVQSDPAADWLSVTDTVVDTADADFWSVVSSGPAIVAAVGDGTVRSYTPFLDSNDPSAVGQLIPRGRTDMPGGETPYCVGDISGALIILTLAADPVTPADQAVHCYQAQVFDSRTDFSIGNLQLKRSWSEATAVTDVTKAMVPVRDELFFTILEDDGNDYLWRYDAVTGGVSRHRLTGTTRTFGFIRFDSLFGFIDTAGDIYYGNGDYEDAGYIITPNITFGLNTPMNWVAVVVEGRQISGGASIEVWRSTDPEAILDPNSTSWILMRRLTDNSQSGIEVAMVNITSRTLAMKIVLVPNVDSSGTPQLTRLGIRGMPQHRDWIIEMPINISDQIEVHGRQPQRVPGWGDRIHETLLDRQGDHLELEIFDPPLLFRGIISAIMEPTSWISPRGSSGTRCIVEFRGNRITGDTADVPTGNAGTGVGLTAVAPASIGQVGGMA